jgi:hypothetical protein
VVQLTTPLRPVGGSGTWNVSIIVRGALFSTRASFVSRVVKSSFMISSCEFCCAILTRKSSLGVLENWPWVLRYSLLRAMILAYRSFSCFRNSVVLSMVSSSCFLVSRPDCNHCQTSPDTPRTAPSMKVNRGVHFFTPSTPRSSHYKAESSKAA